MRTLYLIFLLIELPYRLFDVCHGVFGVFRNCESNRSISYHRKMMYYGEWGELKV